MASHVLQWRYVSLSKQEGHSFFGLSVKAARAEFCPDGVNIDDARGY